MALMDEDAMLKEWPDLLEKFGLAIGAWRQASKQKNAVVHLLTQHGREKVLKRVVGDGLSLDVQRKDGCTCLHLACWKDDYGLVRLLLELGASKDIRNTYGELPLETLEAPGKPARARFICCRSVSSLLTVATQELDRFDVADFLAAFVALAKLPDSKNLSCI